MTTLLTLSEKYPNEHVIQYYMEESKQKWTNGKYYLGGQLPIFPSDVITKQLIKSVDNINITKSNEVPYNSAENYSISNAKNKFIQFKKILRKENIIDE